MSHFSATFQLTPQNRNKAADACIAGALRGTEDLEDHRMTYDVICRLIRNIVKRFEEDYPQYVNIVKDMKMLLPAMHIHAHQ